VKPLWIGSLCLLAVSDGLLLRWWLKDKQERRFETQIVQASQRYQVDPALVKLVIRRESGFNPSARGQAGEIGLMQLRTLAAREWAMAEKIPAISPEHLLDPTTNTYAGTWYLSKLIRRYRGADDPIRYGLADYNAGRSNVLRWTRGVAATNSEQFLARIDFPGTREYVSSISAAYRKKISASSTPAQASIH